MTTLDVAAHAVEPASAPGDHPPGVVASRACYQRGCRHPDCRKANREYLARLRSDPDRRVPAGIVRSHLEVLKVHGFSMNEVARRTGVASRVIHGIAYGSSSRCSAATEAAILALLPADPAPRAGNHKDVVRPDDETIGLLIGALRPPELRWKLEGTCANLNMTVERRQVLFFPMRGRDVQRALALCNGDPGRPACPVKRQCFAHAMETSTMQGIWGGTTGAQRRAMKAALIAVTAWQKGLTRG